MISQHKKTPTNVVNDKKELVNWNNFSGPCFIKRLINITSGVWKIFRNFCDHFTYFAISLFHYFDILFFHHKFNYVMDFIYVFINESF